MHKTNFFLHFSNFSSCFEAVGRKQFPAAAGGNPPSKKLKRHSSPETKQKEQPVRFSRRAALCWQNADEISGGLLFPWQNFPVSL
jgi:hypothetical protein